MADAERYQHYEVLRREDGTLWELGRGAMGITYKAFDTSLRCPVALKVINNSYLNSELARQRFLREARAAASLRHQNVASVFHLGTDHESYFYAMEFIDGETVEAYITRRGLLDPAEALGIVLQVSRALAAADKEQLVHRDLKPSNLMLVAEDDEKVVKVIDFGLAKSAQRGGDASSSLTIGGGFVGTPHFASPEQLEERDIDIRSDIYSLGATLYYMLAGRPPFSGSVAQIMSQHLYKPVPREPLEGLPSCVVELIQRMMEKDPAKRPQRPADLRREILPCLGRLQGTGSGSASGVPVAIPGEQPDTLATLDLSAIRPGVEGSAHLLGQRYSIITDLGDVPQGRRFLADDRRLARHVSLLLFSAEFVSDGQRYSALEQEVDRLHRAPSPLLRQVYSLDAAASRSFLVEEHVRGPSLLDILRARGFLSPPETLLLFNLLAPVADHAQSNQLRQVDITLSGVQLISPRLTETWTGSDTLRQPLTRWDQLGVKVAAVDFSLSASDPGTWAGAATLTQPVSEGGTRGSYLHMLSLLMYELLGGPRNSFESTGRYSPVASLSERGNALLRGGLIDDFRSATEMALQLGGEILAKNLDSVTLPPAPASSPGSAPVSLAAGTGIPPSPAAPPDARVGQPVSATSFALKKSRYSVIGIISVLILVVGVGFGGFLAYQTFFGAPRAEKRQPARSPANSVAEATAQPVVRPSATPSRAPLAPDGAESSVARSRAAPASPNPKINATPSLAAQESPGIEASATPRRAAPASPSAEASAAQNRTTLAIPGVMTSATPGVATRASPSVEASATASRAAPANRSAEAAAPNPSAEAAAPNPGAEAAAPNRVVPANPGNEASATPSRVSLASPSPSAEAAAPSRTALAGSSPEPSAAPSRASPAEPRVEAGATPIREAQARPNVEVGATPIRSEFATPRVETAITPGSEAIAGPSVESGPLPNRAAPAGPSVEATATPGRAASAGAEISATPGRATLDRPREETTVGPSRAVPGPSSAEASTASTGESVASPSAPASVTPNRETLATPVHEGAATAKLEPAATAESRMAGLQNQATRNSSPADSYPDKLGAAQRLIDNNDWPGALKAYLDLVERYPDKPAASRSVEDLLTEWSTNERRLDSETLAQMKPDLLRAAEDGILQAMLIVARSSLEIDRAAALKWYEAAAAKGSVEGMKKAGDLLYSNHQRPDDDAKALDYFLRAAGTGDPDGEYLAGECYFFGKGTLPDIDRAVQYLRQAAARRYPKAMDLLGTSYRKQGKFEQARRSYEDAATAGYALSFYNLGVLYMNGEGVPRSPKKAEEQFRRCAELSRENAEKGDPISMFYYGSWLEQGIGVAKDTSTASEWFRRSARAGYPRAIDWCKRNGVVP